MRLIYSYVTRLRMMSLWSSSAEGFLPIFNSLAKENLDISYLRTYLSILKTFVNPSLVLPVRGIEVVLNAVV